MRKLLTAALMTGSLGWMLIGSAPGALALHGCINAGAATVHGEEGGTPGPGNVSAGGTCSYHYVTGDTYSGTGTFSISCTNGTATATYSAPGNMVPFACNAGTLVTVTAAPGAFVAAGQAP